MDTPQTTVAYLAGKIAKGAEIGVVRDWRQDFVSKLSEVWSFEFLSPDDPSLDEGCPEQIFGHDCYLIDKCDVLIINADGRLGAGTAQEMVIAKYLEKHVLTVLPPGSHHRRSNLEMHGYTVTDWIHPFVHSMSDAIFDSLDHMCQMLKADGPNILLVPPRTIDYVHDAINSYRNSSHLKNRAPI